MGQTKWNKVFKNEPNEPSFLEISKMVDWLYNSPKHFRSPQNLHKYIPN